MVCAIKNFHDAFCMVLLSVWNPSCHNFGLKCFTKRKKNSNNFQQSRKWHCLCESKYHCLSYNSYAEKSMSESHALTTVATILSYVSNSIKKIATKTDKKCSIKYYRNPV